MFNFKPDLGGENEFTVVVLSYWGRARETRVNVMICKFSFPPYSNSWYISSLSCKSFYKIHEPNKVILHKLRAELFLWNRNWDLGWFWVFWQYTLKKMGWLRVTFFLKYCSVLSKISYKSWFFFFQNWKTNLSRTFVIYVIDFDLIGI